MQIALTVPTDSVDERTLGAALEAATEVAQTQIEQGKTQPLADAIAQGLRWQPEPTPAGQESFDIPQVQDERGWGDCDDLAPRWAAELRASGVDPDAQAIVYQSGPKRWHVVVERGDGSIDDPSRWAGMGKVSGVGSAGIPTRRALGAPGKTIVGFAPSQGGVRARVDVPVLGHDDGSGVSVQRFGFHALDALARACHAAGVLALWGAPDDVLAKLAACSAAIRGEPGDYEQYGDFVNGIAAHVDAGQAANLASAFLDPLGIHNLIAPLAQNFVSSFASGLGQGVAQRKGAASSPSDTTTSGDPCPEGYHWEYRGGVNICVPDSVNGRVGAAARSRTPAASSRTASRTSSSRARSTTPTTTQAGAYDPTLHAFIDDNTGLPIDPVTGFLYDASTGLYYDPQTGNTMDPTTHMIFDATTGAALGTYQGAPPVLAQMAMAQNPYAAQGYGQFGAMPGYSPQQYAFGYQGPVAPGPSFNAYPTAYESPY